MKSIYLSIFIIILILIITSYYLSNTPVNKSNKKNKLFYSVNEIEPKLNSINKIKYKILKEVNQIYNNNLIKWAEWPEKELYSENDGWKIFPFYAFGIWVQSNCSKCPIITKFIKNIPGLKLATLSRLKGGTKLEEHEGWATHSNYVIRCHYGLIVPDNQCYIYVRDNITGKSEKEYHKNFEWVVFDDSKTHYAHNKSNEDRIVLILDIVRPVDIEVGKSNIGDSKELIDIIDYFRKKNIN